MSNARFSILQARAVRDTKISDSQFRTLAALGMYADKEGWCYPSQTSLGTDLGKGRRAVNNDISALKELGYLEVKPRFDKKGGRTSNLYRLRFDLPPLPCDVASPATIEMASPATELRDSNDPYNDPIQTVKEAPAAKAPTPSEVLLFREVTERFPPKVNYQGVVDSITKVRARIGRAVTVTDLKQFYAAWCGKGYKPNNLSWLEWAEAGQVPTNGNWKPKAQEPKGFEAIRQWASKQEEINDVI